MRVLTCSSDEISQRMMIPSPNQQHRITTSGPLVHSITRARFSRRFAGLSSSLTCRKIESRPVDFPATYAARRARADRRCASSSSSARVERARIGSVKDRPELPEPCRRGVQARSLSLIFPFLFISTSYLDFPLLPFPSCRRRAFASSPRRSFERRSSDVSQRNAV